MNALPPTTKRRLKKIPQTSAIWEGDRRSLGSIASFIDSELGTEGECVMWVDGSEGAVRAMETIDADSGHEAVVRTLLRAIESPHHPAQPSRPQKIIIRDRQLQFFLRGALQDLDIAVDYAPNLPIIDELFRGFETMGNNRPPSLPEQYESILNQSAEAIWHNAPWDVLADSDILVLEFENSEINTLYACVMGMMSAEYGILLYRSLDSLKHFRSAALTEQSPETLEKAFLAQDCWFLNYDFPENDGWIVEDEEITPIFGSLHPLEGMRAVLDEGEAKIVYLALDTILKFCRTHRQQLAEEIIPKISKNYRPSLPKKLKIEGSYPVKVSTSPELTKELLAMEDELGFLDLEDDDETGLSIREDLIPEGSLITIGKISWGLVELLKNQGKTYYQSLDVEPEGEGLPAILIQTTRPKAKIIIDRIKEAGGLEGICFNPGSDSFTGENYDLGMLHTADNNLYIFAEYSHNTTPHSKLVQEWNKTCKQSKGYCSLIIMMGVTGANRGNPLPKDMLGVFETKAIAGEDLGIGTLELMPHFDSDTW